MPAVEYRGEEFLYLVEVEDGSGSTTHRPFNQTGGSSSIEADSIELDTKDKTGSDYGAVTESISIEGIMTEDDPAIKFIKQAIRSKLFIRIITVNTRDLSTEEGRYKIDSFEQSNANGEFATYTLGATLNGSLTEGELTELPDGAPDSGNDGDGGGAKG